jgi:hypothetical protein
MPCPSRRPSDSRAATDAMAEEVEAQRGRRSPGAGRRPGPSGRRRWAGTLVTRGHDASSAPASAPRAGAPPPCPARSSGRGGRTSAIRRRPPARGVARRCAKGAVVVVGPGWRSAQVAPWVAKGKPRSMSQPPGGRLRLVEDHASARPSPRCGGWASGVLGGEEVAYVEVEGGSWSAPARDEIRRRVCSSCRARPT